MIRRIEAPAARDLLLGLPVSLQTEKAALSAALGRVAAGDIVSSVPVPPFDRSPYDGYAFRGEDTAHASRERPAVLSITGELPAGTAPAAAITEGTAAKILTGAPIPPGANAVVKYEHTLFTDSEVRLFEPVKPGTDIVYAGEDIAAGTLLAAAGTLITPPVLGLLAGQGIPEVSVFRKPAIALLSTGTELAEAGTPLAPAQIYNSNVHTIGGYLTAAGATAVGAGIAPDDPGEIADRIASALSASDMVITTGGASVGDYDWAVTSAQLLGAKVLFWKARMNPGGSIMAAVRDEKLILGLSGNPAAAVLGLLLIAMPYIRKLCGRADVLPDAVNVHLKYPLKKMSPELRILRGRLEIEDGRAYFAENGGQGNGVVSSFVGCDLLGEIPAGSPPLPAGTMIRAYRI